MNQINEKIKINLSSVVRFIIRCLSLLWGRVEPYGSDSELEWSGAMDAFMTGIKKEPWSGSYGIWFCLDLMQQKYLQTLQVNYKTLRAPPAQ